MLRTVAIASFLIGLGACSGTDFSGGNAGQSSARAQKQAENDVDQQGSGNKGNGTSGNSVDADAALGSNNGGDDESASGGPLGSAVDGTAAPGSEGAVNGLLGSAGNAAILTDSGDLIACPGKPQTILIMDFKSGWWAGDGGDFFQKITNSLQSTCTQKVTIEYHHIITEGDSGGLFFPQLNGIQNTELLVPGGQPTQGSNVFSQAFQDPTFASYTQIWVLSGSSADPMDLQTNDPFFTSVVAAAQASKAAFFIGVGYGSISHGNAVAQALNVPATFSTQQVEGDILDPTSGVSVASTMTGSQLKNHVLFTNGVTSLPDDMIVGGKNAHGDNINATGSVTVIATDDHGQSSIAVPDQTAVGRKVVLDAGMPRYYAIWQDLSPGALQYLKNVIVYLSN